MLATLKFNLDQNVISKEAVIFYLRKRLILKSCSSFSVNLYILKNIFHFILNVLYKHLIWNWIQWNSKQKHEIDNSNKKLLTLSVRRDFGKKGGEGLQYYGKI